ncbi:hypothetical protein [Pedobacter sp. GR22-6]|uniref:hypothetical protein n=1 Tax=Pedobacter sp. GR22-6 TaxID=3127957 RepID=UPI00307E9C19
MKLRSQALSLIFLFFFQITGMAQSADGNLKLKPMRSKTGLTISGNLRQLALQSSMVDSLAFEYSDPITGEDIVIPIHRDASGNFSTHLPIQSATQLRLLQGTKTGDKVRFGGLIQFYLYAQPGKDFSLKFFQSADHKERKIEYGGLAGAINTQYQAYTKALDHSEFSRIMEYKELMKAKKDSLEAFKLSFFAAFKTGFGF